MLDGTTETIVRYEDRYLLSDGTTMQDVLRDPASSTDDAVHTTRLVIRQESGAGLVGNGAISERELVVNSGEELMSEEAWERVAHGDMSGASEAIEHSGGEIEASESHYLTDGYNINAKPTADGFGAQFHVQNQRRRRVGDAPHPPREAGE